MKRIRFLYVILAVLVLASVGPLLFYSLKMLALNRQALETNEQEIQNTTTRSIADEISIYHENFHQLLSMLDRVLRIHASFTGGEWISNSPELRTALERFVNPAHHIVYVTYLDATGRGIQAGNSTGENDPFMVKMLERAFAASQQRREYQSDPVLISQQGTQFPAMLCSIPVIHADQFQGMVAIVVNLQFLVERLQSSSTRGLEAFVVDRAGRLVLSPNLKDNSLGQEMGGSPIVQMFLTQGGYKAAATSSFDLNVAGESIPMVGTYCPVQSLGWAVVAQKKRSDAYATVGEMISATTNWGIIALIVALALSYSLSLRIVHPIRILTDASRAIARGDFSGRIKLRSRTEMGELASTFNSMSSDLERYVQQLKDAAERNRKLFLDSIRMIATAVDEKDPYTHGHSERVSRYSAMIATHMGLPEEEIENIRISALLHDVGKIGIEDKILKKPGFLTQEEFEIMRQHPQKGATIARRVAQLAEMVPGIELHHESLDGRGYPFGLQADQIPLMARIIAVADTFDAMTTNRPYQSAMDPAVAIEHIMSHEKRYDAQAAAALDAAFKNGQLRINRVAAMV
ncbi:MAG: HD domain-containing protein [Acidobacteria bacterium]|nr:HD domain-containing protein [Acidobacteriota bacterium]